MRMNYKMYPTDYIQDLKQNKDSRKKARCFQEYFDDMEHENRNSYGFYAKSWEVSKSTAYTWIDEFKNEIALFADHWHLKNQQHYSYAKKSIERLPNDNTVNQAQEDGLSNHSAERSPNKDFNYINNNTKSGFLFDKEYIDLFFVYARNTRFVGKKNEAYESFVNTDVNVDLLKLASMKYLHDPAVNRPVGIKKFLENDLYLPYLPKYMRVKHGDVWYQGTYNEKTFEFISQDGKSLGTIEPSLLIELYEKKELEFLKTLDEKLYA